MPVTLRLFRLGKKNVPIYRIVAIDKRKKRNGVYKEIIGTYQPLINPHLLQINDQKFQYWVGKGAIISAGLQKLLKSRVSKKD
jgi:small subunit ribosomal protein S16